jgi:acyl carrier protein
MSGNKLEKITNIITIVMKNSSLEYEGDIIPQTHLRNDLGLDSLALAEMAVRIEDEFDIDVFEDGLVNTVKEVLEKL